MLASDRLAVGQRHRSAQDMSQLADVAGPRMLHQQTLSLKAQGCVQPAFGHQHTSNQLALVAALAQRRQLQLDASQPVIQVFTKSAFAYQRGQIAVTGADQLKIDRMGFLGPQRRHAALVQHAQQAGLQLDRHVGNFVQEQRSTIGLQDLAPAARALRAGKGARAIAEKLGFDQRLGQARTVDRDELACGVRAGVVHRPGKNLLARTGFAAQQHRRAPRNHAPGGVELSDKTQVIEGGDRRRGRAGRPHRTQPGGKP